MRTHPSRLLASLALVCLGGAAVPVLSAEPAPASLDGWEVVDRAAHPFALHDLEGGTLRSADLEGKIVVIDFWATWCSPCLRELPDLVRYHEQLAGRKDVVLLSVNVTDERKDLEAFLAAHDVPFPVYLGDDLIGPFELVAFPTKVVLDLRDGGPGVVRFRREGYTPVASIEARVNELLATSPQATARRSQ
jgi:thiol-disulfide isomerase/thioredoxin